MGDRSQPVTLDLRTVAAVLDVSPALLRDLAARGKFAPVLAVNRQTSRVLLDDLRDWERRSTVGVPEVELPISTEVMRREVARRIAARPRRRTRSGRQTGPEREEGEDASRDLASLR